MTPTARLAARETVLKKLGLSAVSSVEHLDIKEGHQAHVERQKIPGRFTLEGLTLDVPSGVYHPAPASSSEFFVRNLKAANLQKHHKAIEIGAGSGVISLFIASHFQSKVIATDISETSVETVRKNAALNNLNIEVRQSELFENVPEQDFDWIFFNNPLIDNDFDHGIDTQSLSDPGGQILKTYLQEAPKHCKKGGQIWFSLCNNTAYEVLADLDLHYRLMAFQLPLDGFWRAIVGVTV